MAIEIFQIDWFAPVRFDKALTQTVAQQGGIYIMYVGKILQYVGKSQDFYKRFGTHRNSASHLMTDAQIKKCFIGFGLISYYDKTRMSQNISSEQLKDVESYLINELKPKGNDTSTKKGYKGQPIVIFNAGKRVSLDKAMSNCPDLIKIMKSNLATRAKPKPSSSWF